MRQLHGPLPTATCSRCHSRPVIQESCCTTCSPWLSGALPSCPTRGPVRRTSCCIEAFRVQKKNVQCTSDPHPTQAGRQFHSYPVAIGKFSKMSLVCASMCKKMRPATFASTSKTLATDFDVISLRSRVEVELCDCLDMASKFARLIEASPSQGLVVFVSCR